MDTYVFTGKYLQFRYFSESGYETTILMKILIMYSTYCCEQQQSSLNFMEMQIYHLKILEIFFDLVVSGS